MTLTDAARTIDRLVADLARATGREEKIVRLAYGLDDERLDTLLDADADADVPDLTVLTPVEDAGALGDGHAA
ncbi:hypothetical protein [Actinotalea sp. Marseille-Q4924]|uniref:hypothetical protein n=1 Tax=Actinotalea sp. Marseille-Q4924 TaxID=2866571 RepID=UPI001CE3F191|nr:hypothetical protein [Actinotalea sp. Marseille-Q4924]